MIAKRAKKSATRSLKRTCMYIADQKNTQNFEQSLVGDKAENIRLTNLNSTSLYEAFLEMEVTQSLNIRSKSDKNYHLIVSFPVGEKPTNQVLEDIEKNLVDKIGLGDHQRISIVHNDTDHFHFHVLINKVHPITNNNIEPYYDKKDLMKVCDAMEVKHGLSKTNHKTTNLRKLSESEIFRNEENLIGFLKENLNSLSSSTDWNELHSVVSNFGVCLKKRGAGLVFEDINSKTTVKASSINRDLSLKKLEIILGDFEDGGKIYESRSRESNNNRTGNDRPGRANSSGNVGNNGIGNGILDDYLKRLYKSYDSEFTDFAKTESIHDMRSMSSERMDGYTEESTVLLSDNEDDNLQERRSTDDLQGVRRNRKSLPNDGAVKGYDKNRFIKSSVLYGEFKQKVSNFFVSKKKLTLQHQNEKVRFNQTIQRWIDAEKKVIKQKGIPQKDKAKLYQALFTKVRTLKNEFHKRQVLERSELPSKPTWNEFLKENVKANNEFSETALKTIRNQNKKMISKMEMSSSSKESIFHKVDSKVRLNGTIAYTLANKPAVLDRSTDLKIEQLNEKSVLLAVLVANEKFNGRALKIDGSEEFKKMVVKVINDNSLNVSLKDKKLDDQIVRKNSQIEEVSKNESTNIKVKKR